MTWNKSPQHKKKMSRSAMAAKMLCLSAGMIRQPESHTQGALGRYKDEVFNSDSGHGEVLNAFDDDIVARDDNLRRKSSDRGLRIGAGTFFAK